MSHSKNGEPLYRALKESTRNYFQGSGKSRHADQVMWIKMSLFFLLTVSGYILLITFGAMSLVFACSTYLLFMFSSTLFVVTVAHDASHKALFKSKMANRLLSYSWNFVGISRNLWEIKHHHSHHIYTNIPNRDVDIAESPLLRFSPGYRYRSYYRYQHLYAPFLYILFGIFFVFVKDFVNFFTKKFHPYGAGKLPKLFLVQLLFTKLVYLTVSFIIPLMVLPYAWWQVLAMYGVSLVICGVFMLLILVVPHINEDAAMHESGYSIKNQDEWALHQVQATIDSSVNSALLNWFTGGLNTHLVHHLFPEVCHIHYIQLTRVIKKELKERGIMYKEKTFARSITDHFKYLKLMGMEPAEFNKMNRSSTTVSV